MEINFNEQNNDNNKFEGSYQQDIINYWETPNEKKIKKKVTFDDILTNMNLLVNKEGVLQFMGQIQYANNKERNNYNNDFHTIHQQNYSENPKPIEQSVKHSYIYNKYFKNYSDPNPNTKISGPIVPKTIQEYRQMLLEDKIKAIEHKKMIDRVKSKKMFFTGAPDDIFNLRNVQNVQPSVNNLRTMQFK